MALTGETAQGEGREEQRRAEAVEQLSNVAVKEYPVLTEEEFDQLWTSPDESSQPKEQEEADTPEPPPAARGTIEGGRAIFGYEPSQRAIGNIALAAAVQSSGFRPAGLGHAPGSRRMLQAWQYAKRPSRYPRINDVFESR